MLTECNPDLFEFAPVEGRGVVAAFDGGAMSSDAGALLLGATDRAIGLMGRFASCFEDARRQEQIEHEVVTLVSQRVFGIALGYEDLNDHDDLRHDPVMAVLMGKLAARRQDCAPLAGKSTLNRLELSRLQPTRYHKISHNPIAIKRLFVDQFLEAHERAPSVIVLDLDATDDPVHGEQEGRFFHGYYDCYCYLPLYVFCGHHLLAAKLRPASVDAAAGAVEEVARIVKQIRCRWPNVRIVVRADSGFARDELMAWCEANGVDFVFGLQQNERLVDEIKFELHRAEMKSRRSGKPARYFKEFKYRTRRSWSRERRVVGKAEVTGGEANPRFVVTSLTRAECGPKYLYEKLYCARGDMENRIKECQLDLYADRTSTATLRANQLRLWLASMAYLLICALRRLGLQNTPLAKASCGTIRLKLLKIGALVRTSVRRIKIAMASSCPEAQVWGRAALALNAAASARGSPA
ncbi:MAG: IS1380 family transposase [Xanthobacteraceae bacterium]|jgi:Transposase DDE domain group 1